MCKKTIVLGLFMLPCLIMAQSINIIPKVDERTELMSIVFRLAEAEEYVTDDLLDYVDKIDAYFTPYKNHPLIDYVQNLRELHSIGYDAVMSMAVHLSIEKDSIMLQKQIKDNSIEARWDRDYIPKFLVLLNQFYKESKFAQFFEQQSEIRETAENNFNKIIEFIKFDWFEKFYGEKPTGNFYLIISLANGPNNYGSSVHYENGKEDIFAVIGTWATDSLGNPVYSTRVLSTVIHEFNHSFCNPLINEHITDLLPQANHFFKLNETILSQQAYGNATTVLYEILVRACVLKYTQTNDARSNMKYGLVNEQSYGFIWIENLFEGLTVYENNREKYPTLRSFMPEIVKIQNGLNPQKMYKEQEKKKPVIIGTNIKNGAKNVDPSLDRIIVKFNKPMYSYGKRGKEFRISNVVNAEWNKKTKKEWILYVKLEPNTEYSISFPAQFFITEDFYHPKETYYLDFKTK